MAKKIIKKTSAKKASKKAKSVKKLAKKAFKNLIVKKASKKVSKKIAKKAIVKAQKDYSDVTFEQPDQDRITIQPPAAPTVNTQNTQVTDFAVSIRERNRNQNQGKPVVHMKCRRGFDKTTHGQACKSMRAYKLSPDGSSNVIFTCIDCGFSWAVSVGGSINI